MAQNTFGRNITFPIYNADGTAFHGLELKKATVDSVVMSLGDKVTGDVYYIDNALSVTMQEYIVVNNVKYTLVSPPTIVREGMVADNTQLKGMTKYSFTFYHPMYQLGNIPFTDVAVTQDQEKYLSQNKTFSWIGNLFEFVQKLRANLKNTQWAIDVEIPQYEQDGSTITPQWQKALKQSDVLSFDKNFISNALKTAYDTWEIPFVISHYESVLPSGYTRLKWVRISEIHQSVTNTTAPFWLFIYNLNSVSADNKKIHYCKVFNEDTLLFDLIPCKDSNNNVGLFDVVEGVFYGSNQEVTFVAGGEIGENKKFNITFGLPINKIYDQDGNEYVFRFGKGLGLKNNSRTPRNNKIVTRIVGYGSDRNVPYGYPQIPWTGNQSWDYTINNNPNAANSYPIYDGIVGGQRVRLIKHPFTRTTLMPSIYSETVNNKVNPNATGYDPDIEIKDYYDAIDDATHAYPNNINVLAPSVEVHQFEKEYPQFVEAAIISATPYDEDGEYYTYTQWYNYLQTRIATMRGQGIDGWQMQLIVSMRDNTCHYTPATAESLPSASIPAGHLEWRTGQATAMLDSVIKGNFVYVTLVSSWYNETHKILQIHADPTPEWDDTMNDDGEYIQSYFKIKLPQLTFDLYACAAVTQEMNINMRSGSCMGCTFPVQVDWELYKANFYDSNGNFAPDGAQRDLEKFPKSNLGSIDVIVQKDNDTFGTLMPNQYRYPVNGDKFVILGISLPTSYITTAEQSLDEAMKEYMLENNVHYFDYPLKFDEHFLATHQSILAQIKNNNVVKFQYAGVQMALYIKQITIKYGDNPLPQYDITLTDDVEIVLNQIGQVTDDVSRMRVQVSELQKYYSENLIQEINSKLSKIVDDVCQGRITFQQGLDSLGSVIFHDKIQSTQFEEGLYTGRGWRIDNLGNAEFESARVRSFLEIVELIVNRLQAQEGDTLFTDNDQIEKVDVIEGHSISYILTLKEKYQGYVTGQMYGNVVKGIINTLAAKQAGVSNYESTSVEVDGANKYYTSWMRVIGTHNTNVNLGINQIQVVLYGDDFVPAGRNFAPCELMTIARWGCVDYSDPEDPDYESIKASIIRRQRMFMISTTDGRVVKYTGVDSPILNNGNYGVTIGELPEFVKKYPDVRAILNQVGEHTDWLYAQGIVVGNFIKVDIKGRPEVNIIDCGEWVNGSSTANPTPRNGIYLYNEWNNTTQQYETHDVWHNNAKWRCLQHQPVVIGGVSTYYEPTDANSAYWLKLEYGVKGDSAPIVLATPDKITIPCYSNGNVKEEKTTSVRFSLKVGTNSATVSSVSSGTTPIGVVVTGVADDSVTIKVQTTATASGLSSGVTFTVTGTYDGKTYSATVTVALIGSTQGEQGGPGEPGKPGERGKIGRFFYYAGAWEYFASTDSFLVNDAQAPYFAYNSNYWVFNPETNGTYTKQDMGTPSSSSSNWKVMTSDFKYIITEAIFGSYAHFGSFIINGDWMISTNGTINGVLYVNGQNFTYNGKIKPAYMWFDASNPSNNTGHNFVPNFAINGLTGQGIFGGGKIIFNANGGGQLANGKIVWNENGVGNLAGGNVSWDANGNLTIVGDITANNGTFNGVIKTPYRDASNWFDTLEKGGCIRINNALQGIALPSWDSLEGVEVDIMNNTDQTSYVDTVLKDKNGNGAGIALRQYKLSSVRLQAGSRCKLKAIPYIEYGKKYVIWLILNEGNFDIYRLKDGNNNTFYLARDKSITPIPG
jgi:hypothetical protein|nr:MAG TPA: nucleoid-associated protein [Caudoviricetes sp.]